MQSKSEYSDSIYGVSIKKLANFRRNCAIFSVGNLPPAAKEVGSRTSGYSVQVQ